MATATQTVDLLNAYTGNNIWQDLILSEFDLDQAATDAIDTGASDRFVLADGTTIRHDPQTGQWYDAGEHEGAGDDAASVSYTEIYDGHIADLGMSGEMDQLLQATLAEHDDRGDIDNEIREAITAKIREHGVNPATGEWYGTWSAEETVRTILGRHGVICP